MPLPQTNKGIALCSLAISLVALGLKYAAWAVSGSVALYSDAVETIINVVSALGGLWALSIAERPADHNHTYGHYKAEYLSAVAEGTLVLTTAGVIAHDAYQGRFHPQLAVDPYWGIALNCSPTPANLARAASRVRVGRPPLFPVRLAGRQAGPPDRWTGAEPVAGLALIHP